MPEIVDTITRTADLHVLLKQDQRKTVRIFLVDDSLKFLESASSYIKLYPRLEVVGWSTTNQRVFEEIQLAKPDVVIMDLVMPGLNGIDATRTLKQLSSGTKVIIISFQDGPEYRASAEASGAEAFFSKMDFCDKVIPFIDGLAMRHRTAETKDASEFSNHEFPRSVTSPGNVVPACVDIVTSEISQPGK